MMDVEVDDDWTRTVTRTPSIRPQIGLDKIESSENSSPAVRPATEKVAELKTRKRRKSESVTQVLNT